MFRIVHTRPPYAMLMSGVAWGAAAWAGSICANGGGPLVAAAAVGAVATSAVLATCGDTRSQKDHRTHLVLGACGRKTVTMTPTGLRGGLSISGDKRRAKSLTYAALDQWVARGNGVVICTASSSFADEVARMAAAAGRTEDMRRVDFADSGVECHQFNPFAEVSAKAAVRLLSAVSDLHEIKGDRTKIMASSLLEALVPALVELRDVSVIDLSVNEFVRCSSLKHLVDQSNKKMNPDVTENCRRGINSYLESLPGFQHEKGHKQSQATCDEHNMAVALIKAVLRPLQQGIGSTNRGDSESDVGVKDTVRGRRIVVLRVSSGNSQKEAALRRYAIALADEMLRVDIGHDVESNFLAVFDDLNVEMAGLDLSGKGVLACSTKPVSSLSTRIEIPVRGRPTICDETGERRFDPAIYVAREVEVATPGLRVVLRRPDVDSLMQVDKTADVLANLLDKVKTKENAEDAARALITGDSEHLRISKIMDACKKMGGTAASCAAIADVAIRKQYGIDEQSSISVNSLDGMTPAEASNRFDRYLALWGVENDLASQAFLRAAVIASHTSPEVFSGFTSATPYSLVGISGLLSSVWGETVIFHIGKHIASENEELRRALAWFENSWFALEVQDTGEVADAVAAVVRRILFGSDLAMPLEGRVSVDDLSAAAIDMVFHQDARLKEGATELVEEHLACAVAIAHAVSSRQRASTSVGVTPYSLASVANFASNPAEAAVVVKTCFLPTDNQAEYVETKLRKLIDLSMRDSGVVMESIKDGVKRAIEGMKLMHNAHKTGSSIDSFDFDLLSFAPPLPEKRKKVVIAAPRNQEGIVVVPALFGNGSEKEEAKQGEAKRRSTTSLKAYMDLAGKSLPCAMVDNLENVQAALDFEFPHLVEVTKRILAEVSSSSSVRFKPILLHGTPAAGKTRYARRLCETMGVSPTVYPCGGAADASIGGTSVQWSSGRASVPLQAVLRSGIANPCVVLDEISRTAEGANNGSLTDVILGMTERESSSAYFDLFLEVEVNLSRVLWIATTNSLEGMDAALLSRFTNIEVPLPQIEHAPPLIHKIAMDIAEEAGLPVQFAYRFSDAEIDMIAEAWGGGSIRRLRSLMGKVVKAIDSNTKLAN